MIRPFYCLFAICMTLSLLIGCGGGTSPDGSNSGASSHSQSGGDETRGKIGYSALNLTNPFFKIIADQLTQDARNAGFEIDVTDADSDVNAQKNQVDTFISQGVTAIVINPADRVAIATAVKKANEAGIPVFTCDLQLDPEADAEVIAHVGTDNYEGGRLAGGAMVEALGEVGGEVLVLHFKQANSCVERVRGFTDAINDYNSEHADGKIEIVAELEGGGLQDVGYKATLDAVQQHPNLSGIFAINDPSALGAYTALQQVSKADQIKIVGFDGQLDGKQAIKEGKIYADPIQFPRKMATMTVENIVKYLDGEEFEKIHLIPTELYRQEDALSDPDLQ